jgi:hypothetical protein
MRATDRARVVLDVEDLRDLPDGEGRVMSKALVERLSEIVTAMLNGDSVVLDADGAYLQGDIIEPALFVALLGRRWIKATRGTDATYELTPAGREARP